MQQIFINEKSTDGEIRVVGDDARHLIKVCRIKPGEKIRVSTSTDENLLCEAKSIDEDTLVLSIIKEVPTTELPCTIRLYQAIPKGDRMETVIEKCTELGVSSVVPVEMKYCVVKLDDKKKAKKVERYQNIARSAAQQSKRSVIPKISNVMSFKEAVADATESDIIIVPYENKNGMKETINVLSSLKPSDVISVFIGPEGGFASEEIESLEALDKSHVISLGKRILRTDTAAITSLAMIMLQMEQD